MSHDDDLMAELREARLKKRKAFEAMSTAKSDYLDRKQAHRDAADLVEEILQEVETGKSGRPMLDAIAGQAKSAAQADPDRDAWKTADPGPMDEHQCLRRALNTLPAGHGSFAETHTDDEIRIILHDWPTQRYAPPANSGAQPWAIVGGNEPKFWYGHDASEHRWPMTGGLGGAELVKLVRKEMKIGKPKPDAPTRVTPEMANQRTYPLDEIDKELEDALYPAGKEGLNSPWVVLRETGAADLQIRKAILDLWPKEGRMYVPPNMSGGKHGYTLQGGAFPCLWIGTYKGHGHEANLGGQGLVDKVRKLLDIPWPILDAAKLPSAGSNGKAKKKQVHAIGG